MENKDQEGLLDMLYFGYEPNVPKSPRMIPNNILKWGRNNLAPEEYLYLYYNSTTHAGIVNKKAQATAGESYEFTNGAAEFFAKDINFSELFNMVCLDYWLYNNVSLQVVKKTFENTIHEILYQDPSLLRKTTDENQYAICGNWTAQQDSALQQYTEYPITYVNKFNDIGKITSGFIFKSFNQPGVEFYSYPGYFSCIKSIESEIQLIEQQLNFINNNFTLTSLIKLPTTVNKTQMAEFKQQMKTQMTGPKNAGKMLVVTADGDKAIEVVPLSVPMDFSGIQQGMDLCRTNIIIGHSLASPMIAGLPSMGGLGNDGSALTLATEVWMKTQILPARARLIKIFEELFALAGYETEILVKDTTIDQTSTKNIERKV